MSDELHKWLGVYLNQFNFIVSDEAALRLAIIPPGIRGDQIGPRPWKVNGTTGKKCHVAFWLSESREL